MKRLLPLAPTVADQAASSLGNFILVIAVAGATSTESFGAFLLAYLAYSFALALFRSGQGDVLLLRSVSGKHLVSDIEGFLATAVALGGAVGLVLGSVGLIAGGEIRAPMLAIGLFLPFLLLQDGYRFVFISSGRGMNALQMDLLWLLLQVGLFALFHYLGTLQTSAGLTSIWAAGAILSIALGRYLSRQAPRPENISRWLANGRHRMKGLTLDNLISSGTVYVGMYAIPLVSNLVTLAAIRGAQVLFAPLEVAINGCRLITLPSLARTLRSGQTGLRRRAVTLTVAYGMMAGIWGVLIISTPDYFGQAVLGDTWSLAEPLLLPFAIGYIAFALSVPAMDSVRSAGTTKMIMVSRGLAGMLQGAGILVGVVAAGAKGGATGFALSLSLSLLVWIYAAIRLRADTGSNHGDEPPEHVLWDPDTGSM